jgi:TetR/AcrR family transcriptional regulator
MSEHDKLTEEKIFDAAMDVFLDKGMDGARMQDIASKAGLNKALLHYYYRTKEKLFMKVFEYIANKLFSKFAPVFDDKLNLEEKIRFFFHEHISFLQENPKLAGFVLNEVNRNPDRIKRLIATVDIKNTLAKLYNTHRAEFEKYNISEQRLPQFILSMVSISVFPFAAKGIVEAMLGKIGMDFNEFVEQRKNFASEFVITAIKSQAS